MRFREEDGFVERECLLFEAGEYADRGVSISEDDLRQIAANTADEIPVRIEHLHESPFDGALGVVTKLRAVGKQLWGTLRQPVEAWRFAQKAGARALSVALDMAGRKLLETSFVCRPRVAEAQVFGEAGCASGRWVDGSLGDGNAGDSVVGSLGDSIQDGIAVFEVGLVEHGIAQRPNDPTTREKEERMNVRQFAEGLIQYLRGVMGGGEEPAEARFAAERASIEAEKEALRARQIEQQIGDLKRHGLLRGTDAAEGLARAILQFSVTNVVQFGGESAPLSLLFMRFLEENGAVVPMGEIARADSAVGGGASERLISMARDAAKKENLGYLAAFAQVSGSHPELARAAREEAYVG